MTTIIPIMDLKYVWKEEVEKFGLLRTRGDKIKVKWFILRVMDQFTFLLHFSMLLSEISNIASQRSCEAMYKVGS